MARYTQSLYEIAQALMNNDDDLMNPETRERLIRRAFFENKKPLLGENYDTFTSLFTHHYFFREIGAETPEMFDIFLYSALLENKERISTIFTHLNDLIYDEITEEEGQADGQSTSANSGENSSTTSSRATSTSEGKTTGKADTSTLSANIDESTTQGNDSTDTSGKNTSEGSSTTSGDTMTTGALLRDSTTTTQTQGGGSTSDTLYSPQNLAKKTDYAKQGLGISLSSTPQGELKDVKNGKYLSSYQYQETDPYSTTQTESGTSKTTVTTTQTPATTTTQTTYTGTEPTQTAKTNSHTTTSGTDTTEGNSTTTSKHDTSSKGASSSKGTQASETSATQKGQSDGLYTTKGTTSQNGTTTDKKQNKRVIKKISREGLMMAAAYASPLWEIFDPLFMGIY